MHSPVDGSQCSPEAQAHFFAQARPNEPGGQGFKGTIEPFLFLFFLDITSVCGALARYSYSTACVLTVLHLSPVHPSLHTHSPSVAAHEAPLWQSHSFMQSIPKRPAGQTADSHTC